MPIAFIIDNFAIYASEIDKKVIRTNQTGNAECSWARQSTESKRNITGTDAAAHCESRDCAGLHCRGTCPGAQVWSTSAGGLGCGRFELSFDLQRHGIADARGFHAVVSALEHYLTIEAHAVARRA